MRGVLVCERLSADMGLHLMEIAPPARSALHSVDTIDDPLGAPIRLYELQGAILFAGAESALRAMVDDRTDTPKVAIDLTRVHQVNDVGRRMLLECVRRLVLEDGDGIRPRVAVSVHELTH